MTTSLSIDATTSSLLDNSAALFTSTALLASRDQPQTINRVKAHSHQSEKSSLQSTAGSSSQILQQLQSPVGSGSTSAVSGGINKKRSTLENSGQQSSVNFSSSSPTPYQIIYSPFSHINQQQAYFSNGLGGVSGAQSSQLTTS